MFVKYIQQETQTRVQIKGQGSGFIEQETGRESDEPMHIHIAYVFLGSIKYLYLIQFSVDPKKPKFNAQNI